MQFPTAYHCRLPFLRDHRHFSLIRLIHVLTARAEDPACAICPKSLETCAKHIFETFPLLELKIPLHLPADQYPTGLRQYLPGYSQVALPRRWTTIVIRRYRGS
ncbi:hypothetical protein N7466_004652 [Penicillium verhagenii]|uniref:uncharacterized protein n=1 Tax=Penicillium verhagenii TaxID=1562060 RepID=UPI002545AF78|nr:uncharacterized protein N7466_004652 [Penicillium verhagenii]KAJ5935105.1 hypothetical protein N7466_004652 [Penicillium verhagenii]